MFFIGPFFNFIRGQLLDTEVRMWCQVWSGRNIYFQKFKNFPSKKVEILFSNVVLLGCLSSLHMYCTVDCGGWKFFNFYFLVSGGQNIYFQISLNCQLPTPTPSSESNGHLL